MADYYTKVESDSKFAPYNHTHNLEDMGGSGIFSTQVKVPEYLSGFYDNAVDLSDALSSIKGKFGAIPESPDLSNYALKMHTHHQGEINGLAEAFNGKADKAHTHDMSGVVGLADALSGKADTAHKHSYNDLADKPTIPTIPDALPANGGNADTVGGKKVSDFAAAGHNHDTAYVSKGLQATDDKGGVEFSFPANSGKNVLDEMKGMEAGFHTVYAIYGTAGNPDTTESYRYFLHKTSASIGWVLAFGSTGSIYANYINGASGWLGWKTIFDATPKALWNGENNGTGGYIMNASHTVTPSKPLSQCRTGWMLIWADFDPDTKKFNDYDFCSTVIPKIKPNNGKWTGQPHIFPVAAYMKNGSPYDAETIRVKTLHVYDDKLVGHAANSADNRNDIVLRAVYEI